MKRGTLIYIALAAYAIWYFSRKKNNQTNVPSVKNAASSAKQMVANVIDQTTFLPDTTTDADRYATDKSKCL